MNSHFEVLIKTIFGVDLIKPERFCLKKIEYFKTPIHLGVFYEQASPN